MASLTSLLSRWRADPSIGGNMAAWHSIRGRNGSYAPFPKDMHPALAYSLTQMGVNALFSHQDIAWRAVQRGENIGVVTNTASGKTLCYNLPVLDGLIRSSDANALFLFPTKALAQDQLAGVLGLLARIKTYPDTEFSPIAPATYDGDTPSNARSKIRNHSRLIISNPDMLHSGILPHHTRWSPFFKGLRFVVLDEMHTYRGVFGSHVANIIRRLKRMAAFYGADPQFILTSATIGNPKAFAEKLIEAPVTIIDEDGSEQGAKHFLIYNPPIIDTDLGLRAGIIQETTRLAEDLLAYQVKTIIFGRTRRTVEIILRYLQESEIPEEALVESATKANTSKSVIKAYRSGYLARDRREIETGLRDKSVGMVIATTALELGIDIGDMSAAVLAGYPGTISGTWQQAGRAGRGKDVSVAILIVSSNPLDQFLAKHPEYLFDQAPEQALINPDNLLILLGHIQCAAYELPFKPDESFGALGVENTQDFLEYLTGSGTLYKSGEKYFWMADQYPAADISLRTASANRFILQKTEKGKVATIGEVDGETAFWMVHPAAIYLHQGEQYHVDSLDLERKFANLRQVYVDYYTRPRQETEVLALGEVESETVFGCVKNHGEIVVSTQIIGFHKIQWGSHEKLGYAELDLPTTELNTQGYWLAISEDTVSDLRKEGLWSNDPNNYGPNWHQQRDLARQRDGFVCQVCSIPEGKHAHHVHHKTPFRAFTSAEDANQLDNLVTICPPCHQRVESGVRIRSGLAGLAHIIGNLAPMFLMCDGRDLGIHHDPKPALTQGVPAVVIYERTPGGIGFSQRLYEIHQDLMEKAKLVVAECSCGDGCPSCVGPGGEGGSGSKKETLAILEALTP